MATPALRARPNALADIHFASAVDTDLTPSEDEAPEESPLPLETVQSAIGVSIGKQQTHLTSPQTPAAEKAAALEDLDGSALFDGWDQVPDDTAQQSALVRQLSLSEDQSDDAALPQVPIPANDDDDQLPKQPSPVRLPSPWRAGAKTFDTTNNHRAVLRDHLHSGTRRRALSGGSASDALKKYLPFNLPSMNKTSSRLNFSLPSFSVSSLESVRSRQQGAIDRRKHSRTGDSSSSHFPIASHDGASQSQPERRQSPSTRESLNRLQPPNSAPIPQHPFSISNEQSLRRDVPTHDGQRRPDPILRRSNSEGSFLLYRSKSFASSLGDDTRFENVQEQVNSRLKAIKDSWQDSNFKLPSMPSMPSFSNFNLSSRDDLFRPRNESAVQRGRNLDDRNTNKVSFLSSVPASSSRAAPRRLAKPKASSTDLSGMASSNAAASHPFFTRALEELQGDLVVLGGYRGSILRSAEAPNRQLWVPFKVGLNLRKVDLEVGLNPEDEETEEERIYADGMLTNIGPVDIAKRLFKRLRASENAKNGSLRIHDYGYDWRLSPHLLSRRMIKFLESLPCNQPGVPAEKRGAIVIAHSLGGLITRHVINQRPDLIAGIVYAGVPQNCINILGPLRNGDDVLLSSRVLTAQVNFTIRTSYALLPLDGKCFINKHTKEAYPVDFFDFNTWKEHRLSPCIAPALPSLSQSNNISVSGLLNAMSQAFPSFPRRKSSVSKTSPPPMPKKHSRTESSGSNASNPDTQSQTNSGKTKSAARDTVGKFAESSAQATGMEPKMTHTQLPPLSTSAESNSTQLNPATAVTIPYEKAAEYLKRTLADVKRFKEELAHIPAHTESNSYPPIALIYGKSIPTVYGAKVESLEAIKRADVYDELAFASGDGVVLARAAMVPTGYSVAKGGVVSTDRGHVTMLGDLEAVGRCLHAVVTARKNGVGMGKKSGLGIEKDTETKGN